MISHAKNSSRFSIPYFFRCANRYGIFLQLYTTRSCLRFRCSSLRRIANDEIARVHRISKAKSQPTLSSRFLIFPLLYYALLFFFFLCFYYSSFFPSSFFSSFVRSYPSVSFFLFFFLYFLETIASVWFLSDGRIFIFIGKMKNQKALT